MGKPYTSLNNREILFSRLIRRLSIVGLIIYISIFLISIFLLFFYKIYLSNLERLIIVIVSLIPLMISTYSFYIYEKLYNNRKYSSDSLIKILMFSFYLLVPSVLIIFRYNNVISNVTTIFGAVSTLLLMLNPFFKDKLKPYKITDFVKDTMFSCWTNNPKPVNTEYFDKFDYLNTRTNEYFNKINLDVFQDTFLKVTSEHLVIANHIKNTSFLKKNDKPLNILDIGGHNGKFTSLLLEQLKCKVQLVKNVDPVYNSDYEINIKPFANKISFHKNKFEDYIPEDETKYDLILASHSIYSLLDLNSDKETYLINKLQRFLKDDGLIIILLGSNDSPAYQFKNEVFKLLTNEKLNDSTAEILIKSIDQQDSLKQNVLSIDNYFDANQLFFEQDILDKWVSYFTRTQYVDDKYLINQIKKILLHYSNKLSEMPKCAISNLKEIDSDKELLLHKTKCILLSTNGNNVYSS